MPKHEVLIGQVDYTALVFIPDPASTDGSGKTGLVAADLTVSGVRVETDNDVTVTDYTSSLNNLALLTTAHTDWGVLEVSSTLCPGLYRLDIADALYASGAWSCVVYVMITTSAAAASPMEFVLVPSAPLSGVLLAPVTHTSAVIPTVTAVGTLTTYTGNTVQTGDSFARIGATGSGLTTLASQTSVDDLPTNAELATALGTADDAVLTAIAALNNLSAAQVNTEVDTALADINLDHLVKIAVDTDFATTVHLNSVVGQLADNGTSATFDRTTDSQEAIRDRGDAAWVTGTSLDAAGVRTAVGLASANLDTQLGDLPTNAELATALAAADDAILTAIAALNNLSQANIRTAVGLGSANLDTQLGDLPTNAELATALGTADDAILTAIAALNNLSAAQVNAEVLDVLSVDTFAEPGQGTPSATTTLAVKLGYLYKAWRNRTTQTSTTYSLYNDDATTVAQKATVSDNATTFDRGEVATGP